MREIAEKILTTRERTFYLKGQGYKDLAVRHGEELAQAYLDSLQKIERLAEENAPNKQLEHHTLSALIQAEDMVEAWQRGSLGDVDTEEWYLLRDHLRAARELREEK